MFIIVACEDVIFVEDISGENISILAPSEGTTLTNTSVTFSWNPVEDAEHYRLQIATPSFESASQVALDSLVSTTNFTMTLNANDYQWRVRAENSGYHTVYVTQNFSVNTSQQMDISDATVELLAPGNAVTFTSDDTINFSWELITGADNYIIQIARPSFQNATEILENEMTSVPTFSISNLAVAAYEWRVKALNSSYETNYTTQSFTVEE